MFSLEMPYCIDYIAYYKKILYDSFGSSLSITSVYESSFDSSSIRLSMLSGVMSHLGYSLCIIPREERFTRKAPGALDPAVVLPPPGV